MRAAALLERERELDQLTSALRAASRGEGSVVVIHGQAGIGKTELLRAARDEARRLGLRALSARGGELERAFTYGVARQLFEPILATLGAEERAELLSGAAVHATAIADPRSSSAAAAMTDPSVVPHGLYWLTANLATRQPQLLIVDDAHWADVASLQWLIYLARRIAELPVCALVAAREAEPGAPSSTIELLLAQQTTQVLSPGPLSNKAVGRLAHDALGHPADDSFIDACRAATGGNPFYITELLRTLRADGSRGTAAEAKIVRRLGPQVVASTMLARLARMAPEARSVAQAVAVLEPNAELRHVAELAELPAGAAAKAVDALIQTDMLTSADPCRLPHPLLRAALEAELQPAQRALAHRRAASMLERSGAAVDAVAAHLLQSIPSADRQATEILLRAGRGALAGGAPASAVEYLRRALAEPPPDSERAAVLLELGVAETQAREPGAIGHLEQALALAETRSDVTAAAIALGQAHVFIADMRDGYEVACKAADALAAGGEPAIEIEAFLLRIAVLCGFIPETEARLHALQDRVSGSSPAELMIVGVSAYRDVLAGEPRAQVRRQVERTLIDGRMSPLTPDTQSGGDLGAIILNWLGDYGEATRLYDITIGEARAAGSQLAATNFVAVRAVCRMREGDLVRAEADIDEALALDPGMSLGYRAIVAQYARTGLLLERGQAELAEQLATAVPLPPPFERMPMALLLASHAGAAQLAQGRFDDAVETLSRTGELLVSIGAVSPGIVPWRSGLGLALAGAGRRGEAIAIVSEELQLAERAEHDRGRGIALRALGLIEGGEVGLGHLERAVRILGETPSRLEYARALVDHGAALRRANRRSDAREQLRQGVDIAHRCTATALVQRGQAELRALGARPRSLVLSGVESLTASEARVARMAAEGLTNREIAQMLFVSLKTVEKHLGSGFMKLRIHSRRELAAALAPRDP